MGKEQEFMAKVLKCANECARHEWNKEVEFLSLRGVGEPHLGRCCGRGCG